MCWLTPKQCRRRSHRSCCDREECRILYGANESRLMTEAARIYGELVRKMMAENDAKYARRVGVD